MENRIIRQAVATFATLFVGIVAAAGWFIWTRSYSVDFVSFWAAGRMLLDGAGPAIYDIEAHRAVEESAVGTVKLMPFPYPPPFGLIVAPFGIPPYGAAFTLWMVATGALFLLAAERWMPRLLALAQPSLLVNGFIGQAGFLTSALFMGGMALIGRRPLLGGALLGVLVIKPQLALLLPLALAAGKLWRAFAGAALSSIALVIAAMPVVGFDGYAAFLTLAATFSGYIAAGRWPWDELASVYALLSYFGVPRSIAIGAHLAIAAGAAALVWRAWRNDHPGKVATLAAATLLIPPYLMTYDGLILALPIAFLLVERRGPGPAIAVWLLSLLPVGAVAGLYEAPNTLPLAALLALLAIERVKVSTALPPARPSLPQPA
ncbi:MAG TPA: glycosyltransferase family 87 protein [Sphingomicrobium sp.]